jgi:hypothetical protein
LCETDKDGSGGYGQYRNRQVEREDEALFVHIPFLSRSLKFHTIIKEALTTVRASLVNIKI